MFCYKNYIDSLNQDLSDEHILCLIEMMIRDHMTPYCFDAPSYMARSWVEASAAMAIAETDKWMTFQEIYDPTSKIDVEKLVTLKSRMIEYQIIHHAAVEINQLGMIDREWKLQLYDEATFEFTNEKNDNKITDLPRGLTREAYREIIRAYLIGTEHGRQEAQVASS
jgi:hypothetical protein